MNSVNAHSSTKQIFIIWEPNLCPLEDKCEPETLMTELSLQLRFLSSVQVNILKHNEPTYLTSEQ